MIDREMSDQSNPVQSRVFACFAKCALCVCQECFQEIVFEIGQGEARRSRTMRRGEKGERNNARAANSEAVPLFMIVQEMMICVDVDDSIKLETGR